MANWLKPLAVSFQTTDHVLTSGIWWCAIIWLGFFGGAVGSFLTVVWDRLGTGEGFETLRTVANPIELRNSITGTTHKA